MTAPSLRRSAATHLQVHEYKYICVCIYSHVCMYVCMHACACPHFESWPHHHVYIHTYVNTCVTAEVKAQEISCTHTHTQTHTVAFACTAQFHTGKLVFLVSLYTCTHTHPSTREFNTPEQLLLLSCLYTHIHTQQISFIHLNRCCWCTGTQ
jgi:hypothetical protein